MSQWYYAANGAQQGPVSQDQLAEWVRGGQLPADALVWRDGMAQWQPAGQVSELAGLFAGPAGGGPTATPVTPQPSYDPQAYVAAAPYGHPPQGSPLGYAQPQSAYGYQGYQPGGFWWRVLAYIVDYIVLYVPSLVVTKGLESAMQMSQPVRVNRGGGFQIDPQFWAYLGLSMSISVVINWLYFAAQESSKYQATLGKRVCGLVVTDLNGQRLTFGRATGRYFGKILSAIILYIGFIMVAFTQRKQGLHDLMAGTLVWKKP